MDAWNNIQNEFAISKRAFAKRINFVTDKHKRKIIFRDVEHAYILASHGFSKPAVILAGGVIEELLRIYLEHKKIPLKSDKFFMYIETCKNEGFLKLGINHLLEADKHFRNLVHLKEETKKHTISKATAKGVVSSIFTITNSF
jgi:hypothetical protein